MDTRSCGKLAIQALSRVAAEPKELSVMENAVVDAVPHADCHGCPGVMPSHTKPPRTAPKKLQLSFSDVGFETIQHEE